MIVCQNDTGDFVLKSDYDAMKARAEKAEANLAEMEARAVSLAQFLPGDILAAHVQELRNHTLAELEKLRGYKARAEKAEEALLGVLDCVDEIAEQTTTDEMHPSVHQETDFEEAYDHCIKVAREARKYSGKQYAKRANSSNNGEKHA